jgi:hypothetical protein
MMLILEDDIIPKFHDHFVHVQSICNALTPLANKGISFVCHLGVEDRHFQQQAYRRIKWNDQQRIGWDIVLHHDKSRAIWLAHAYIISKAAAIRLSKGKQVKCVADDFLQLQNMSIISKIFIAKPGLYVQDDKSVSTVQLNKAILPEKRKTVGRFIRALCYRTIANISRFIPSRIDS